MSDAHFALGAAASARDGAATAGERIWRSPAPQQNRSLEFEQLGEALGANGSRILLANGAVVLLADWPATLVASSNIGDCTASIIGPQTMLTAAHCVDGGGRPALERGGIIHLRLPRSLDRRFSCMIDPEYRSAPVNRDGGVRSTRDYALCTLEAPLPEGAIIYETLATQSKLALNTPVLLTGFGCTDVSIDDETGDLQFDDDPPDKRKLRMGDETISGVSSSADMSGAGSYAYTISHGREPTLCPGDSGGPVIVGQSLADQQNAARMRPRRIVGVNSAVGWSGSQAAPVYTSYLAPLATPDFESFLRDYLSAHASARVCGVNLNQGIGGCHV